MLLVSQSSALLSPHHFTIMQSQPIRLMSSRSNNLTHVNEQGEIIMVDVTAKQDTVRTAIASGKIFLPKDVYQLVEGNNLKKGDVLSVAKLAGIMGAKQCSNLIPLCHNINLTKINVDLSLQEPHLVIRALVTCSGKTGVEMEALTAVSIAALTVYDMCKAVSHDMVISDVKLERKSGGKNGDYISK